MDFGVSVTSAHNGYMRDNLGVTAGSVGFSANGRTGPVALIFDMDGVVVDSNSIHRDAWIEYNARNGIATTGEMLGRMYGKRNDEIVRDFFGEHLTENQAFAHGAAKEALFREMIAPNMSGTLVPGIREFLIAHQNLPIALATNAEAANADFVLRETGLLPLFRFVVDGQQVTHAKPHPEIYLLAAKLLGVDPAACIVFEDSYAGVAAGIAAGMRVVGIQSMHRDLPGTVLTVPDFRDGAIHKLLNGF